MKLALLYNTDSPDPMINFLKKSFSQNKIKTQSLNIKALSYLNGSLNLREDLLQEILAQNFSGILNRVVPSSQSEKDALTSLLSTAYLEKHGLPILNPETSAQADYSKSKNYQSLKEKTIPTPETHPITDYSSAREFASLYGFPLIIKDEMGGKGTSVKKIKIPSQLEASLEETLQQGKKRVLQEFIKPSRDYDCRIIVVSGEPLFTYGRTLTGNGDGAWKGSKEAGSSFIEYQASPQEIALAVRSTQAINAGINAADLYFSEKGPIIIENNPTPGYSTGRLDLWGQASPQVVDLSLQWLKNRQKELPSPSKKLFLSLPELFYPAKPALATY